MPVSVHQLRVVLAGVSPLVWRRLVVTSASTLADLHQVLQVVMGWEDYHLHAFADTAPDELDESALTVADLAPVPGDSLRYVYDFGDEWLHLIEVEKVTIRRSAAGLPRCTAGRRACPPEDVGGPHGYADMLRALRARKGWRYHEIKEWLAGPWDPNSFDRAEVDDNLRHLKTSLQRPDPEPL